MRRVVAAPELIFPPACSDPCPSCPRVPADLAGLRSVPHTLVVVVRWAGWRARCLRSSACAWPGLAWRACA